MAPPAETSLDRVLALQIAVAWAGEGRCEPRRLGWWDTDLVDEAGGGDLFARLTPRTHAWAALEALREAARRVDAKARGRLGDPDKLRTLFFLGFDVDERVSDRLADLKRRGITPGDALPLPFAFRSFSTETVAAALTKSGKSPFKVVPNGRELPGAAPTDPGDLVCALAAGLVPFAADYPLPFFKLRS